MNQYIITEEDICTIRDYILGAFYEGENKEKIYDLLKAEFSVVRSHPYNPQAEHHCGECAYFAYANANHPTTEKMIEYFKNIIKCNSRWENLEPYYRGVNAACEDAIAKLREGKDGEPE